MQLDMLWAFMQVDMEADRFENDMRQAPNRLKLIKHRDFIVEQQANMKRIEEEVAEMCDRMEVVSDEAARLEGVVRNQAAEAQAVDTSNMEAIEERIAQVQKLLDTLNHYEQELQKLRRDAEVRDRQQREIRVRAAKAKSEYDEVREIYNREFKRDTGMLTQKRKKAEAASQGVKPALLERYQDIKQHASPPMAKLVGGQCGGCYMSLPSVAFKQIQAQERIVECDNCGRILYAPPEEE
jgi:predicted  nucleic acid-binding Zn-ribbon protein